MGKNRKAILYVGGASIGLIIMALLLKSVVDSKFNSKIPVLVNSQTLSQAVLDQISDALENAFHKASADNLGELGMAYHSSANYKEAAQCYELAISKSKSEWIWNYYQGYLSMEMGESDAVIENFNAVIGKNPNKALARYYLGAEYKNLQKYELAEESFEKILSHKDITPVPQETSRIDHFPIATYAMFQLSRIYYETERIDLAEKTLMEIIKSDPTFGPAYRLLGNVYNMEGKVQLGKRFGVRANDLIAYSPPVDPLVDRLVLLSRSELYLPKKIDDAERSIYAEWTLTLLNNALLYMPDNKYLISKAIRIFLWIESDKEAISLVDQHIGYYQESFIEINNKGDLFYQNGLYPQAITYFKMALVLKPENVEIQNKLAISLWFAGDKQEALVILDGLFDKNQANPEVQADIVNILFFNLKSREKAREYLSSLKKTAPSNPKVLKVSAGVAEENGDPREAISLYESSFRGDPEDITTIKFLGNLLVDQNLWEQTLRHYNEALEFHPNDSYLLERYGTLLVGCPDSSLRDIDAGIEYLERAFIHKSSRPNTLVYTGRSLAFAYARLGDTENAVSTMQQTIVIARRANFSSAFIEELENMLAQFRALEN